MLIEPYRYLMWLNILGLVFSSFDHYINSCFYFSGKFFLTCLFFQMVFRIVLSNSKNPSGYLIKSKIQKKCLVFSSREIVCFSTYSYFLSCFFVEFNSASCMCLTESLCCIAEISTTL